MYCSVRQCHCALPMPIAILELTDIFFAIWPSIGALPTLSATLVLTNIFCARRVCCCALPIRESVLELTDIFYATKQC